MYDLDELFLFRGLCEDQRDRIKADMYERKYERGDTIYRPDSFEKALGVFLEGKGVAGRGGVIKNTFKEGSVFGAAAMYGSVDTYISEIYATTGCLVAFLPEKALKKWIEEDPTVCENYISFLSDRIRYLNMKIEHFTLGDGSLRLLSFMKDNEKEGLFTLKNASETAKMVGLSRSRFYETLGELEEQGKIRKEDKKIFIL